MKKYFCIVLFLFYSLSQAQIKNNPYIGQWVATVNNQTFKIKIYEEGAILKGDYQLYEIDKNGAKKTIYTSNKLIDKEFNMYYGHAFFGNTNDKNIFTGTIRDNVLLGDKIHTVKTGELTINLKENNHINWKIIPIETYNRRKNLKIPQEFSIPTNITLTQLKK